MPKAGVAGWIRSLTERSERWAETRSHPAYAVWPVVPAPLDFRYRNPLTMTTSSRQEPLTWGAGWRRRRAVAEAEVLKPTAYQKGKRERGFEAVIQLMPRWY